MHINAFMLTGNSIDLLIHSLFLCHVNVLEADRIFMLCIDAVEMLHGGCALFGVNIDDGQMGHSMLKQCPGAY